MTRRTSRKRDSLTILLSAKQPCGTSRTAHQNWCARYVGNRRQLLGTARTKRHITEIECRWTYGKQRRRRCSAVPVTGEVEIEGLPVHEAGRRASLRASSSWRKRVVDVT